MPRQTPEQRLVADYTKDWKRLRTQKFRHGAGVEVRVLTNLAMVFGEQYVLADRSGIRARGMTNEDKNRLWLVFNLIGKATWRKIGRLWSIDHQFRATPNTLDPAAFDRADVVNQLMRGLNRKTREGQLHWNRLFWLLIGGVVIEHTPWVLKAGDEPLPVIDPDSGEVLWKDAQFPEQAPIRQALVEQAIANGATPERFKPAEVAQMVGDVGAELYTPLDFFIDAGTRSIRDLAPDQKCYLAEIKTRGWIRENFGADAAARLTRAPDALSIVQTRLQDQGATVASLSMRDLIPSLQGSLLEDDPDSFVVLTAYGPKSDENPSGTRCIFVPDQAILDEDDLPYEDVPLTDIHWQPNATSFWTGDFVTDLVPGQKFLNRRMSQLGEAANAQIYETLLLGGGLKRTDIPTDLPGTVENGLAEDGTPLVAPMQRGQLPGWFVESIRLIVEFIDTVGGADLLAKGGKFPGQLRGPLAIPMLQEILDSEDGPRYTHLGEALAEIHQKRVNRVKQYYPEARTLHYTGENNRDEVLVFQAEPILRAGYDYFITVDPGTLLPELSSLREARVRERLESPLQVLYLNRRTGKIDVSKIADDLKYGDKQREERETQYRKLARQLIAKLWDGQQLDPALPMPFWDHNAMMDELESAMATTEWLNASMPVKQNFWSLWQKHQQFLQAEAQAAQQAMQSGMMQSAIAQATQQAAAQAAGAAADMAIEQVLAQSVTAQQPPGMVEQVAASVQANAQGRGRVPPIRQ